MSRQHTGDQSGRQYVQRARVAATLLDGPKTFKDLMDRYYSYFRVVGFFKRAERQARNKTAAVRGRIEESIESGWVIRDGEIYALTSQGQVEVTSSLSV